MCLVQKGKQLKLVLNHFGIKFILKYNIYLVVFRGVWHISICWSIPISKGVCPMVCKIRFFFPTPTLIHGITKFLADWHMNGVGSTNQRNIRWETVQITKITTSIWLHLFMDFLRYIVCTETCLYSLHNTAQVFNYGLQTPDVHLNTSDEA